MKYLTKILRTVGLAVVALVVTLPAHGGGDELAIIVNNDSAVKKMNQSDLRPIFQTTKTSWSGGKALPLNLPPVDGSRKGFDAAVLGLDPDRVARYWVDRKIRGGNPPPKKIPNAAMIVKVVSLKAGAIGYVPIGAVNKKVRVVAIVRGGRVVAP